MSRTIPFFNLNLITAMMGIVLTPAAMAQNASSTYVATACVPHIGTAGKVEHSAARFRFAGSQTGMIAARCNVGPGTMSWNKLEVVFRDPDARNSGSRVTAILMRVHPNGGVSEVADAVFDSSGKGSRSANAESQVDFQEFPDYEPQFDRFAYYIELKVERSGTALAPDISLVRLIGTNHFRLSGR